ncbi:hypothetical protein LTR62_005619 [Meristemomyces frigidus]|uniref:STF2-like protein n=1 Tax=Meristemomyces frigidus TaxID=1508187 RepID=A0AAN7YJ59_9PEZI|nr:hypothetical protein LTR62_005619 [Meristemomyces frigidus]
MDVIGNIYRPNRLQSTYPSLSMTKQTPQTPILTNYSTVTRTHKTGDRDHVGLANGTAAPEEHLPRYFAKAGYSGNDPTFTNTKKQGAGKGNWGRTGDSELEDYDYNSLKPRRRTNSSSQAPGHSALKTKFEALDPEVIEYDEVFHGPAAAGGGDLAELEKMSTASSADTMAGSMDGEEEGVAATATAAAGTEGEKK